MATARAERLVNLVLCLLSTRQYLTAERIRTIVPGYADAPSGEAFFRTFERDKAELRDLGIPLETGRNSMFDNADGYRIARGDYELGEIDLEPDEAAALALAVRLWESSEFTDAAHGALLKLRAAGVEVDQPSVAAIEPKVRTGEPAFGPLLAAVRAGRPVRFDYRRPDSPEVLPRTLEPWGVVSSRGRWYVVGYDRDRQARRCFRLSRITGPVRAFGKRGEVTLPVDADLASMVRGAERDVPPTTRAVVWIAEERAQGLRRRGRVIEPRDCAGAAGELVELELRSHEGEAGWIAGFGPDVLVIEPETLRKDVAEIHLGAIERAGGGQR